MDMIQTCASKCNKNSTILDIGGNEGGYTYTFQSLPHKEILTFEPCPKLADKIKERFKNDPSIKVFQVGVSDREFSDSGYTVFQAWTIAKKDEYTKRGLSLGALELVGKETFSINFITIDSLNLDNVDFIKLDVDGYELRVLKGAEKTIMKYRPFMLTELSYLVDDIGDSVPEFLDFIYDRLQYRLYDQEGKELTKDWLTANYPWHTSYDVVMLPSEINLEDIKK